MWAMTLLLLSFKQTGTNWTELLLLISLCILREIFYKQQIITLSHVTGIVP